ncbi:hypothetical protein SAMN04488498_1576 [Mesorhizobium albiziae]|uniref:DUF3606 domain-containing protein n=1 Tax=Neomesorhizobium albiziae TaxID=335020 RepID=A0A1I4FRY4_9HYPH|nr:hypothetical protein [Mesorhizobium albiziae]GLS31166.1 hypothetical protein GCM10007937_28750 [Mesorhizobium albiziae]SFL20594.1 hypothetical protein SAMN04488498_1576 [Mesorhizobium albiziae]
MAKDPLDKDQTGKDKTEKPKRRQPSKGEEFEVKHLAETTDLSPNQARELLRRHGPDWRKIEEVAKNYKAES